MSGDHFRTLGVPWGATDDEIKRAYKKQAKTWHPDKNTSAEANQKFHELNKAYEILMDPKRRDRWEHEYVQRHGVRPKHVSGNEVVLRPDMTVDSVNDDDFTSWTTWAETEDFDKDDEDDLSFTSTSRQNSQQKVKDPILESSLGISSHSSILGCKTRTSGLFSDGLTEMKQTRASDVSRSCDIASADSLRNSSATKPSFGLPSSDNVTLKSKESVARSKSQTSQSSSGLVSGTGGKLNGTRLAASTSPPNKPSSGLSLGLKSNEASKCAKPSSTQSTSSESRLQASTSSGNKSSTSGLSSSTGFPVYTRSSATKSSSSLNSATGHKPSEASLGASKDTSTPNKTPSSGTESRDSLQGNPSGNISELPNEHGTAHFSWRPEPKASPPHGRHSARETQEWFGLVETILNQATPHPRSSVSSPMYRLELKSRGATYKPLEKPRLFARTATEVPCPKFMDGFSGRKDEGLESSRRQKKVDPFDLSDIETDSKAPFTRTFPGAEASVPSFTPDKDHVAIIVSMGFPEDQAIEALMAANGALELACELLISQMEPPASESGTSAARIGREKEPLSAGSKLTRTLDLGGLSGIFNTPQVKQKVANPFPDVDPWEISDGLDRDARLDQEFLQELAKKHGNAYYRQMLETRQKLPVHNQAQTITQTIEANQVTLIKGETGCGKTTQVAQFILDDYISKGKGSLCRIVCTQPRRISARMVGHRVAHERAERCGSINGSVGYQIKNEPERPRARGSILFCTTGIVLKWLENDINLRSISHLILDEVHERELHTDFLLIIMKDILPKRPDLKFVLMSATLNAQQFSEYYGGCPTLTIPGRTFPVEEIFLEEVVEKLNYRPANPNLGRGLNQNKANFEQWLARLDPNTYSAQTKSVVKSLHYGRNIDFDLVVNLIRHISTEKGPGAILVFMPGWDEISNLKDKLKKQELFKTEAFKILPLHSSMMSTEEQQKVFDRPPDGVRKIVIATNVAETSITIDDVVFVIDCGKIKLKNYDARRNISTLQPEWNSRANSEQRKGRAGRVQPGECYHLYTRYQHDHLVPQHKPEMLRIRLEETCLQIKLLNRGRILEFFQKAMESPSGDCVAKSIELLKKLKAFDDDEELTSLGFHLARLPVDPHIGKMIIYGALFGCLDPILTIAACLDYKSPFFFPKKKEREANERKLKFSAGTCSDHIMFVSAYNGWLAAKQDGTHEEKDFCWVNFLSKETLKRIKKDKQHMADNLSELGFISIKSPADTEANIHSDNMMLVRAVLCAGLYPNVVKVDTTMRIPDLESFDNVLDFAAHYFKLESGQEDFKLHPKSVLCDQTLTEDYLIYYHKMHTSKVFIHDASCISSIPLLLFASHLKARPTQDGKHTIVVDSSITLGDVNRTTVENLRDIRNELFAVIEEKFDNPEPTDWSQNTREGRVMQSVLDRLSATRD